MGVVDAVGVGVPATRIGERVWVWNAAWGRAFGTAAQYVVLPAAQAVPLPGNVADEAGACLGIPALTALHAVLTGGGVAGRTVLVAGGAGAVGFYAVQFARLLGARRVLATVSNSHKAQIARDAGADVTIDYRAPDTVEQVRAATNGQGVDRVIEVDIAANAALDLDILRPGGDLVVYGSGAPQFQLTFFPLILKNLELRFFIVYNLEPADRALAVQTLTGLLERGALQHLIAERLPLAQIAQAHELVEQGRAVGNVVLALP
jgi:NADPH2:quinone reductase